MKSFKSVSMIFLSLILLLTIVSCEKEKASKTIIFSGDIKNPTGDSVFIQAFEDNGIVFYAKGALDETGHFTLLFDLDHPKALSFYDGKESTKVFLFPGDTLHIALDTKAFDETIKYSGTSGKENNFLAAYYLKFTDLDSENVVNFYPASQSMEINEYCQFVKDEMKKQYSFFEDARSKEAFDDRFNKYFNVNLLLESIENPAYVFFGRQDADSIPEVRDIKANIAKDVIAAKSKLDQDFDKALYNAYLSNSLPTAVRKLIYLERPKISRENFDSVYYERLSRIMSSTELNYYIFDDIHYSIKTNRTNYYLDKKPIIEKYLSDTLMVSKLEKEYLELQAKLEKGYAKGLNLYDFGSDKEKTFNDIISKYKGKIIYLDIWASWCGPCKAELPYSKKLKKKFEGRDVAFIYLSTDRKLQDWENILVLMQLEGEHYRGNKKIHQYLASEFNLQYIPHYIVFDKNGKMVKNNAPRPSSTEVTPLLESLL